MIEFKGSHFERDVNSANGNPDINARLGEQYGDVVAIFALPCN
jgi:hypothetical protein